ncbi:L-lysine 2,3-aminomutase [Colletotrichum simmondsii]|uniref:L-lysine 2,3-aminomutase n=1 Tax=Colletotrichum simmondsii TaxID=703756 RepID=A0A135SYG0_9PEZI|nr:L-lysine 2,3-aminomutase [Colletotrichum simmondsii]
MLSFNIPVRAAARSIQTTQRGQGARWIATPSRLQAAQAAASETAVEEPMYHDHVEDVSTSDRGRRDEFWRKIPWWQDISTEDFLSYRWSSRNMVERLPKLRGFLDATLPEYIPVRGSSSEMEPRNELVNDVLAGIKKATMSVRLTPYVLSRIDWTDPRNDPIFRQFIPTQSSMVPDHPRLTLDSLHEEADSPVSGLVHRYPDKALFLRANTETVDKHSFKPILARWEKVFQYIENTPDLQDIVVSGGDSYYLAPHQIELIGDRLISMPNIRRFRFASKGLAVCPTRILDPNDTWVDALVSVSNKARRAGKAVALHTHFNHPNEISWVSEEASQKLFEAGVVVRNQTVLLRGVNDDVGTMSMLIRKLANNNILPCDMVKMVEHLRTPLQTILDLESKIRGSIAGFVMPQFVVDLPGGGGKRLASTHRSYDRKTGISTYVAPAVTGRDKENKVYEYYDPVDSLPETQPTDFLDGASRHTG